MSAVKHAKGVKLVLKVGNGASPEVFTAICSINAQRGISFNGQDNEFEIPDCADPEKIAWLARERRVNSASFDGAGMTNTPDVADLHEWWSSGETRNAQVVLDVPGADGGVIFEGGWKLSTFAITGERSGKVESTLRLDSDGEITSDANA